MLSQEMTAVIDFLQNMQEKAPREVTPHHLRAGLDQMAVMNQPPEDGIYEPVEAAGVPAEWVFFADTPEDRVLLHLHGGGYVAGSIDTHREFAAHISRATRHRVLLIDYRLAPENPFPAALEDAVTACHWLLAEAGFSPQQVVIAGDSAGGGLTLATLLKLKEVGDPLPRAAVCLSPWTDLAVTGESIEAKDADDPFITADGVRAMAPLYVDGYDPKNPLISPLYGDFQGLPPLLIHVGERECLLDDSRRVAVKARQAGVAVTLEVWPELVHVFHLFAAVTPEGKEGIRRIADFLETV